MSAFISGRKDLEKFIMQEPLVLSESMETARELEPPAPLYFGVGLCNTHSMTQGMPLDVLGMILVSETIGSDKHVIVADTHAKTNGFAESDIDRTAHLQEETLHRLCENLKLPRWSICLASDIDGQEEYSRILGSINRMHRQENNYVRRELADIEWFRANKGVKLKVGWKINGSRDLSETFFDRIYSVSLGDAMSFIYTEPGRTFNPKRPKAAPYFCDDRTARIMIEPGEDVRKKFEYAKEHFGDAGVKCYKNFLRDLARLYGKITGSNGTGCLEDSIQEMIARCAR